MAALKFNVMLANMGVPGYSGGGDTLRGAAALSPNPPSSFITNHFSDVTFKNMQVVLTFCQTLFLLIS